MTNNKHYTAFRYILLNGDITEKQYKKPHTANEMYSYFKKWCRKNEPNGLDKIVWLEYFNCHNGKWC